jgi:uncharacterized protein
MMQRRNHESASPEPALVLVFLKAPRLGSVKTRLAREVGSAEAVRIYRLLVERQMTAIPAEWRTEIRFSPDDAGTEMRVWLGDRFTYRPQGEGDLGARLARGFEDAFRHGAGRVIAIGGDCPELDAETLVGAAGHLDANDLVLGPARDGGYYLIGLRRPAPRIFAGIPWSTAAVLAATLARSAESGLRHALLAMKEDIDDLPGWRRHEARTAAQAASLAIIIPALNEATHIRSTLAAAQARLPAAPIVVVDGGSGDGTAALAAAAGARVIASPRGRGVQCRMGASAVAAEWLLFLHADTLLPANAAGVIARFIASPTTQIATFRLRFDTGGWLLRACGWCTRFDSVFTRFGDQGILVRRTFYEAIGGFAAWPLFEDVDLLRRARRKTKVHSLPAAVTTSARRFERRGNFRQQCLNARLLLRYLCGASPEVLAAVYRTEPAGRVPAPAVVPSTIRATNAPPSP